MSDAHHPRAVIHKQILKTAESNPNSTLTAIAEEVSGASTDLVENVLAEYGDPAQPPETESSPTENQSMTGSSSPEPIDEQETEIEDLVDTTDLSERQLQTLREIQRNPEASQQEIAENLGLTAAAISNRLSDIDGFDWNERKQFVNAMPEPRLVANGGPQLDHNGVDSLRERVEAIERTLDGESQLNRSDLSPELIHKVLHACMESERISEEEELDIIRAILPVD